MLKTYGHERDDARLRASAGGARTGEVVETS
jgi:hypothetical protein